MARQRGQFYRQLAAEIARREEFYSDLALEFAGRMPVPDGDRPKIVEDALLPDGTFIDLAPGLAFSEHQVRANPLRYLWILPDGTIVRTRDKDERSRRHEIPEGYHRADKEAISRLIVKCQREAAGLAALRRKFERAATHFWLPVEGKPLVEWEGIKSNWRSGRFSQDGTDFGDAD
jgi:hypothetical protein